MTPPSAQQQREEMARQLAQLTSELQAMRAEIRPVVQAAATLTEMAKAYEAMGMVGRGLKWLAGVIAACMVLFAAWKLDKIPHSGG